VVIVIRDTEGRMYPEEMLMLITRDLRGDPTARRIGRVRSRTAASGWVRKLATRLLRAARSAPRVRVEQAGGTVVSAWTTAGGMTRRQGGAARADARRPG
jgi:hypothetical protein